MKISVVIPTYNRRKFLKNTLASLYQNNFDKKGYEVIVVDDGSKDNTISLLEEYKNKYENFRYFTQPHKGASAARNLGIKNAKGEIIAFTDSDCIVDKNWLKEIKNSLIITQENIIAVSGKVISQKKPFTHSTMTDNHTNFISCNIAVRKDILVKIGGFDEQFVYGHEDTDLAFRLLKLGKIKFNPNIVVYHPPIPMKFIEFIKRIKISYRNESLLYWKYPKLYKNRKFISAIMRAVFLKQLYSDIKTTIYWVGQNPFIYFFYIAGLIFQRIYLIWLIIWKKENFGIK